MGFFITESIDFPVYGVSAAGCYITVKGSYIHQKAGVNSLGMMAPIVSSIPQPAYTLVARYYVYASKEDGLSPLHEDTIRIGVETIVDDPLATIYNNIKSQKFSGKTFADDL